MKSLRNSIFFLFTVFILSACEENYTPKPKGYMRIDFPVKTYKQLDSDCPFSFEYPKKSFLENRSKGIKKPCWYNLHYPQYANTVHLSYTAIQKDSLFKYIEDARELAMKHIVKANEIEEKVFSNDSLKIYGIAYDFSGETATNFQFFLTDSSNHFFRGAMYFNLPPNPDSLAPVEQYIKQDLLHLIETFRWKPEPSN